MEQQTTRAGIPGFYNMNTDIDNETLTLLPKLVAKMRHKLETLTAAFFIGTTLNGDGTLYFLLVTSDSEKRDGASLCSMVEQTCRSIAELRVFVHNAPHVQNALSYGSYFFSTIIRNSSLVYLSGDWITPKLNKVVYASHVLNALAAWQHWSALSGELLEGARFYVEKKCYSIAVFTLHQSVEFILKGLNKMLCGYMIDVHNLSRLVSISRLYTEQINNLWKHEARCAFDFLKQSYSAFYHNDSFDPDGEIVCLALEKVAELNKIANKLYLERLSLVDNAI